jgi:hypothetical protein
VETGCRRQTGVVFGVAASTSTGADPTVRHAYGEYGGVLLLSRSLCQIRSAEVFMKYVTRYLASSMLLSLRFELEIFGFLALVASCTVEWRYFVLK